MLFKVGVAIAGRSGTEWHQVWAHVLAALRAVSTPPTAVVSAAVVSAFQTFKIAQPQSSASSVSSAGGSATAASAAAADGVSSPGDLPPQVDNKLLTHEMYSLFGSCDSASPSDAVAESTVAALADVLQDLGDVALPVIEVEEVDMRFLAMLCNWLQGELFIAENIESRGDFRDGGSLESGTKSQRLVVAGEIHEKLKLVLAGTVTLRRGTRTACFPICKAVSKHFASNFQIFVCADILKDVTSECPVPAWFWTATAQNQNQNHTMELDFDVAERPLPKYLAEDP